MRFSEQLEAKCDNLMANLSSRRAVVLPLALFVQQEMGAITSEIVGALAERLGLTESQVRDQIAPYSMLGLQRQKQPIPFPAPNSEIRRALLSHPRGIAVAEPAQRLSQFKDCVLSDARVSGVSCAVDKCEQGSKSVAVILEGLDSAFGDVRLRS